MHMPRKPFIALLRGINVSGHNKVPMTELRSLCLELGWQDVQTYIQSGNLVFTADRAAAKLEEELEGAITRRFGLAIAVLVRAAVDWSAYVHSNPFPDVSASEPSRVMLALSKTPPKEDAVQKLRERAVNGERIEQVEDAIWVHFAQGAATTKLSPALLDRLIGSPVTMRNWNTVLKLHEMAQLLGSRPKASATKQKKNE
jgi:uncharacterized protein (DUF1697 family)